MEKLEKGRKYQKKNNEIKDKKENKEKVINNNNL